MSYLEFKNKFGQMAKSAGLSAKFRKLDGEYSMVCSDGTRLSMTQSSDKITVRWGSGHLAMAEVK